MLDLIVLLLLAGNLLAFALFWFDKEQARAGGRRLSERSLLLAVAYGGLGALLGQHILRHKTRKQPFATWMLIWLWLQIILLILWATGILGPLAASALARITAAA